MINFPQSWAIKMDSGWKLIIFFANPACKIWCDGVSVDCVDPDCSGHGYCVTGSCVCRAGWRGDLCHLVDDEERRCQPDCSGHGVWDTHGAECVCQEGYSGESCSIGQYVPTLSLLSSLTPTELCDLDCGPRGHCEAGGCVCNSGWHGERCHLQLCDPRCSNHGMCSNGTCLCTNGWNGLHCTLEGCPGNCNGHGTCSMPNYRQQWECLCESGWYGAGCQIRLEQRCDDRQDNDEGKYWPLTDLAHSRHVLQTAWWTARTRSAASPPCVNTPSSATPSPLPSTSSWGNNRQPSPHPSTRGWGSSSRTGDCRATPRRRDSMKGRSSLSLSLCGHIGHVLMCNCN